MAEPIRIAENFYRKKNLLRVFAQWQKNVVEFKEIGLVHEKCDHFHGLNLIGKSLTVWQTALERRKYKNDLHMSADTFRKTNLTRSRVKN